MTFAAYEPRSAWAARPARGSTALSLSAVVGEALHWPGTTKPINAVGEAGKARVASALRGWQNYHMDTRGWSDIAYQIAVDQVGRAWTLRGLNIRSGANGDANVNRLYGAFLLVLAPGEQPSAAMKATVQNVIRDFRAHLPNASATPKGHKDVRAAGTDCPGPLAYAAIKRGEFTPSGTPGSTPTPPTEDDMAGEGPAILAAVKDIQAKSLGRYQRSEQIYGLLAKAIGALAAQVKAEDVTDDAALAKAVADLEAAIAAPKA